MLDFNHGACKSKASSLSQAANTLIDATLQKNHDQKEERTYLGASRLGVTCSRALQYEYTHTPRDRAYTGQTLRIFEIGHVLEKMAWQWLQNAGFEIETCHPTTGNPYGFSVAGGRIQVHVDGILRKFRE